MKPESLFNLEHPKEDDKIRQDQEEGVLKPEKLSKDEVLAMLPEGTDESLIKEHNGIFFVNDVPLDFYLGQIEKEKQENLELEEEQELLKIKDKNIHKNLLKKVNGKWLACGMDIDEFFSEREKVAEEYNVALEYLSKKEGGWYVLYHHNEEIPIKEWEKRKEEEVVDKDNKTAKQILEENGIDFKYLKDLILMDDDWYIHILRLGKNILMRDYVKEKDSKGRMLIDIITDSRIINKKVLDSISYDNGEFKIENKPADEWIEMDRRLNEKGSYLEHHD